MNQRYSNLNLYIAEKNKPVGCGYFYIITTSYLSHTAFTNREAFKKWLRLTGLKIGKRGWGERSRSFKLEGQYHSNCVMLDNKEFFNTYGHLEPFEKLCNGDYSIGFVERDELNGNILHYQNPNTNRFILEYKNILK